MDRFSHVVLLQQHACRKYTGYSSIHSVIPTKSARSTRDSMFATSVSSTEFTLAKPALHAAPPALAAAAAPPPPSVPAATPQKKLFGRAADTAALALATVAATPPPSVLAATPQPECPGTGAAVVEAAPIVPAQRVWSKTELGQGATVPNSKVCGAVEETFFALFAPACPLSRPDEPVRRRGQCERICRALECLHRRQVQSCGRVADDQM